MKWYFRKPVFTFWNNNKVPKGTMQTDDYEWLCFRILRTGGVFIISFCLLGCGVVICWSLHPVRLTLLKNKKTL